MVSIVGPLRTPATSFPRPGSRASLGDVLRARRFGEVATASAVPLAHQFQPPPPQPQKVIPLYHVALFSVLLPSFLGCPQVRLGAARLLSSWMVATQPTHRPPRPDPGRVPKRVGVNNILASLEECGCCDVAHPPHLHSAQHDSMTGRHSWPGVGVHLGCTQTDCCLRVVCTLRSDLATPLPGWGERVSSCHHHVGIF